ncbi:MAG: hypothetical protein ACTSR0_05710 [Candidatus Asgardarchaeia archaeon]
MPGYNVLKYELGDFFLLYTGRKRCAALFCTKVLKTKPIERGTSPHISEIPNLDFSLEVRVSKSQFEKYFYSFIEMDKPFSSIKSAIMNERLLKYVSELSLVSIEGRSMTGEAIEKILMFDLWKDLLKAFSLEDGMIKDGTCILISFLEGGYDVSHLPSLLRDLESSFGNLTTSLVSSASMDVKEREFHISNYLMAVGEEDGIRGFSAYLNKEISHIIPARPSELKKNLGKIISRGPIREYSSRVDEKLLSEYLRGLILI